MVLLYSSDANDQVQNIRNMIHSHVYDIIISTDGSSSPTDDSNLGPTGAGAVINYRGSYTFIELRKSVCILSNNYEAELHGIDIAFDYLIEQQVRNSKILVLTDCIPTLSAAFSNANLESDYNNIIHTLRKKRDNICKQNDVLATWVPGHKGVMLNEAADRCAKTAAAQSSTLKIPERKVALSIVKDFATSKSWSFRYKESLSNHYIYEIGKEPGSWNSVPQCPMSHIINQLMTGHYSLKASQSIITGESDLCACGEPETRHYFLHHCEFYMRQRSKWLYNVNLTLLSYFASTAEISPSVLFGQCMELSRKTNLENLRHLAEFLTSTGRFNQ